MGWKSFAHRTVWSYATKLPAADRNPSSFTSTRLLSRLNRLKDSTANSTFMRSVACRDPGQTDSRSKHSPVLQMRFDCSRAGGRYYYCRHDFHLPRCGHSPDGHFQRLSDAGRFPIVEKETQHRMVTMEWFGFYYHRGVEAMSLIGHAECSFAWSERVLYRRRTPCNQCVCSIVDRLGVGVAESKRNTVLIRVALKSSGRDRCCSALLSKTLIAPNCGTALARHSHTEETDRRRVFFCHVPNDATSHVISP